MQVDRLADGLWRWAVGDAACVYHEAPDGIVLLDPLVPDDEAERFWRHLDQDVARVGHPPTVVVTTDDPRSAAAVRDRYPGARVLGVATGEPLEDGQVLPGGCRVTLVDGPMALVRCACHGLLWLADAPLDEVPDPAAQWVIPAHGPVVR